MQMSRWACAAHLLASGRVPAVVRQQSGVGKGQAGRGAVPMLLAEEASGLRLGLELLGCVPPAARPLNGLDPCLRGWLLHPRLGPLQVAVPRRPKGLPRFGHQHPLQGSHPPLPVLLRVTPLGVASPHMAETLAPQAEWHFKLWLGGRCWTLWLHILALDAQHGEAMTEPDHSARLSVGVPPAPCCCWGGLGGSSALCECIACPGTGA